MTDERKMEWETPDSRTASSARHFARNRADRASCDAYMHER